MKILDCTLRDGGYYNNWDFDENLVASYLESLALSNVDYVELGLRNFKKDIFLGAFAYTTDEFLSSIDLPKGPTYGVMIDAKTILKSGIANEEDALDALFTHSSESKISLVRVAAHFDEVEFCGQIVKKLNNLGYTVCLNFMQAGGKCAKEIAKKAKIASGWKGLDVLYFADSLGNMDSEEVQRVFEAVRSEWKGPIGIHTHNNMDKGLSNTLKALELGVEWVDSTVTGMGRGAGNTKTEFLLASLEGKQQKYNAKPIYELAMRHFEPLQKNYGWGSNLLYFLGAEHNIHPTYIQNLISNNNYGTDEMVGVIDYLKEIQGSSSFDGSLLEAALQAPQKKDDISGDNNISHLFHKKDILLITNAPSTIKYKKALELYIKKNEPIVISINIVDSINIDLIDYYVISHNSKFLSDKDKYTNLKKPIIMPKHRFVRFDEKQLNRNVIYDFGIEVKKDHFECHETYATIPYDHTTAYILAILSNVKVKSIRAVGFDGYPSHDMRQAEMNEIIDLFLDKSKDKNIIALTPSTYSIDQGSLYAPEK
jgi:4-hydroxy 2-oxovalerate aldolase